MDTFTREISRTFGTSASPLIDVGAIDGSIRVRGEERDDVHLQVSARIRAGSSEAADELMRQIENGIEVRGDGVKVHTSRDRGGRNNNNLFGGLRDLLNALNDGVHVEYELIVPRGARVELKVVNGEAVAQDIIGEANVQTVNGAIRLANIGGNASARTVNGKISIERCDGDVSVNQKNGDVELRQVRGRCTLRMLNGSLQIVEAGSGVHAHSLSGEMTYRGAVRGDVSLNSAHGSIDCLVPRDARFSLDATSHLGSVTSELPVGEKGGDSAKGAPHVSLRSQTGSITLRALEPAAPGA